jgi:hypothetical protein
MPVARSAKVAGSGTIDAVAVPEMSKAWTPSIDCQWFAAQLMVESQSQVEPIVPAVVMSGWAKSHCMFPPAS